MTVTYKVFGLTINFPREISSLKGAQVATCDTPDVIFKYGSVPPFSITETVNDDLYVSGSPDVLLIEVDEVGRFEIRSGNSVTVDIFPSTTQEESDLYLSGSILGAVLHQRNILPLHCNAFEHKGRAILLCGDSGAGKSTLAAWFEGRGYRLLTDDVCAITFNGQNQAIGHPGIPRLRLWDDALKMTGRENQPSSNIPWAEGKVELQMSSNRSINPLPIAGIYHLKEATPLEYFSIDKILKLDAINTITTNIYRRRIGDLVQRSQGYLLDAVKLSNCTPIFQINRRWGMENFQEDSLEIEKHALSHLK